MVDEQKPSPEEAAAESSTTGTPEGAEAEAAQAEADTSSAEQGAAEGEGLEQELAAVKAELAEQQEAVLRAQAELQNVRRRAERDVENAHKYSQEKLINELLPVVDNLERALAAMAEDADSAAADYAKSMKEGVEMTLSLFLSSLAKFKVEPVDPEGEPFDPQQHQAMSMIENDKVEPNTVLTVMQKGYTLSGRLIRPAMVMVSKARASEAGAQIDEQA